MKKAVRKKKGSSSAKPAPGCHHAIQPKSLPPRSVACPSLDWPKSIQDNPEGDLVDRLSGLAPLRFPTPQEATLRYGRNQGYVLVYVSSLRRHGTGGLRPKRFSAYAGRPASSELETKLRFVVECPVKCWLASDWDFEVIAANASADPTHLVVGRHPKDATRELLEAIYSLEAKLHELHPQLPAEAIADFFTSFEVHKHILGHVIKMRQAHGSAAWKAWNEARQLLATYVEELERPVPSWGREAPADIINHWCRKLGWKPTTDLVSQSGVAKNTIRRIMAEKPVRPSSITRVAGALIEAAEDASIRDLDLSWRDLLPRS